MNVQEMKQKIGQNQTERVLEELVKSTPSIEIEEINSQVLMLSAKWKENKKKEMLGIIDSNEATRTKQQVNYALLELLNEIDKLNSSPLPTTPMPNYNIANIVKLLTAAFDDIGLRQFCMMYFETVHNNIGATQDKRQVIMALVEYCKQHNKIQELLDAVKSENPEQ